MRERVPRLARKLSACISTALNALSYIAVVVPVFVSVMGGKNNTSASPISIGAKRRRRLCRSCQDPYRLEGDKALGWNERARERDRLH